MPQHGRRRAGAPLEEEEPSRYGFLTMESALVLGLVAVIVLGAFLVHAVVPSKRETTTTVGNEKVRVTTVGKGGVLPGPLQYREVPAVIYTPPAIVEAIPTPTKTKKPKKTPTPIATSITDPGKDPDGPIIGGGGGQTCTVLILCRPGETVEPEPSAEPEQPTEPTPAPVETPKKKRAATPDPSQPE